jgi:outer membrane protein
MIKKLITCSVTVFVLFTALPLYADDLMQVYYQALRSDPTFKKAEADWLTTRQNYPVARAGNGSPGSGLFPYIDVSGNIARNYQVQSTGSFSTNGYYNGNAYLLELTQPIFNYATWKSISSARFQVRAAAATYIAAAQDLMFRVSQAYFNVLRAYDQLQYVLAQKKSFLHQLITAQQKFHVGLIAITGVYDAQASYDQSVAQEIADRNNLQDQLENLRAITGRNYRCITGLRKKIPLVIPQPQNIDSWVLKADQQNYTIKSSLYSLLSARENVKQIKAQGYPTLTGSASYGVVASGSIPVLNDALNTRNGSLATFVTKTTTASLNLNFPVYQGGYVGAAGKQAEYKYLSASDQLEFTHRDVVRQTRQAYWGVQSGISQVQADRQAIISAANKLDATQAGYEVGTRTMVDVLQAVTQLYQSQQTWANDRYSYVINIVTLKEQAGTLSPRDLEIINTWLGKPINLKAHIVVKVKPSVTPARVTLPKPSKINATPPKGGLPTPQYHGARALPAIAKNLPVPTNDAAHYAIQVFAARRISDAHLFIQQHADQNELHVVKLAAQPDWYKVVYGYFTSGKQATQALQHLPAEFANNKPWVVNVADTLTKSAPSVTVLPAPAAATTDKITSFAVAGSSAVR